MDFNSSPSTVMHIDLNSCFASVEQQANPLYRRHPLVVAAYASPGGCILASSVEAKAYGIKTGMHVGEAKKLYPNLIVLLPDPAKYRFVHQALKKILKTYTFKFYPKSIDEFVLDFAGFPAFDRGLINVAKEIKSRIKKEIGDWLTVSIGLAPNRLLAKLASNLHKPDGLDEITKNNFQKVYKDLGLKALCGINYRNELRLNKIGIFTVLDFYKASYWHLKSALKSALAYYWYLWLRGWETSDNYLLPPQKTFGNSYALPARIATQSVAGGPRSFNDLLPILQKLSFKTGARMRHAGFVAAGVHLSLLFRDWTFWHKGESLNVKIFDSRDIYKEAKSILYKCPSPKPVHTFAVTCFNLSPFGLLQLDLFENQEEKLALTKAIDQANDRWGDFSLIPARTILAKNAVADRIAFGK
jgi:DNA polymerase-4